MKYTSKTFKGSISETTINNTTQAYQLENRLRYEIMAISYWEKEKQNKPNDGFAKEQVLFFTDAKNLVEYKLSKFKKEVA